MIDENVRKLVRKIKRNKPIDITKLVNDCIKTNNFQPMYDIDYKCVYNGCLWISGMSWFEKLPNYFTVNGWLDCSYSGIKVLPENLKVYGILYCTGNNIISLPNNLYVMESLDCRYNNIEKFNDNMIIGGCLLCSNNKLSEDTPKPKGVVGDMLMK